MRKPLLSSAIAALMLCVPAAGFGQVSAELDAYWAEVARTVVDGDYDGYAALYHPDAVLVTDGSGSQPIASALAGWKQLFDTTADGSAAASVEFRLTDRLNDATTAHELGMFRYSFTPSGGEKQVSTVHFSALLVKKNGAWLMIMERQQTAASDEEWAAAGR